MYALYIAYKLSCSDWLNQPYCPIYSSNHCLLDSLVSGSMKRQDIVAYFYVRIVKRRWTHMLHPNSRFLTLLRGQNFPSWRTGFNSLLKPQLFIISKYLGGQIKCQGRDHGLRTSKESCFFQKSQIFGLWQTNWAENFCGIWGIWGIWGTFGQFIHTHFGTVGVLSMFCINQPLFVQKTKPLYSILPKIFGIGIWIWAAKN